MSRAPILEPGSYGSISTGQQEGCRTWHAATRVRTIEGARRVVKRRGATPEDAERHLRAHLHALGLTDARAPAGVA